VAIDSGLSVEVDCGTVSSGDGTGSAERTSSSRENSRFHGDWRISGDSELSCQITSSFGVGSDNWENQRRRLSVSVDVSSSGMIEGAVGGGGGSAEAGGGEGVSEQISASSCVVWGAGADKGADGGAESLGLSWDCAGAVGVSAVGFSWAGVEVWELPSSGNSNGSVRVSAEVVSSVARR